MIIFDKYSNDYFETFLKNILGQSILISHIGFEYEPSETLTVHIQRKGLLML